MLRFVSKVIGNIIYDTINKITKLVVVTYTLYGVKYSHIINQYPL